MAEKLALYFSKFISAIGHPILLGLMASLYVNFKEFEFERAQNLSFKLLVFCLIPLILFIYWKIRKGEYQDFDVSNQSKRNGLYIFIIGLLGLLMVYIFLRESSWLIKSGVIPIFILVISAFFINKRIKVSLHTSFAFLLAIMMIKVELSDAFTMLLFAVLIGFSRLYLKRHSIPEVALGALLGVSIGFIFHFIYSLNL
jgi:membrane-associated phospholipid phosphatase